jgi:hypothetical protein
VLDDKELPSSHTKIASSRLCTVYGTVHGIPATARLPST